MNTGQVKLEHELGRYIATYASDERFHNYLEIGTWNGRGSTYCFHYGFKRRSSPYSMQSYETSLARVKEARDVWKDVPSIEIIHGRVLESHECPTYEDLLRLFPRMNESWHAEDIMNFHSCIYVAANAPEVVLLDGAEYLTYFEFQKLKTMPSIRVFLLDDTNADKCRQIKRELERDTLWGLVASGNDRNGWAVFERLPNFPNKNL